MTTTMTALDKAKGKSKSNREEYKSKVVKSMHMKRLLHQRNSRMREKSEDFDFGSANFDLPFSAFGIGRRWVLQGYPDAAFPTSAIGNVVL
jgi:hypothetical protein